MAHRHGGGEGHQERDDLTGEHRIGDAGQIVLACLFAAIWIADTVVFKYTTFLNQYIPSGIRIPIGVILFVLSAYLAKTGLSIVFGEKREEPVVIRKSVFGIVRHPVYLAEILLYLGFLVLTISVAAAAVWVVGIFFLHYISCYEEGLLLARFGEDYKQYMREVPMWIPRLRRR
jgi:protein-S-isoprenylcysteine O-methyltransferase Ste14